MWFLIALAGGLYWIIRIAVSGGSQSYAIRKSEISAEEYEKFLRSVCDIGLEHDLTRRVKDPRYEDEITSEIMDVWESLPAIYPVESMYNIVKEKVAILLAKRGFLSSFDIIRTCHCVEQKRYHALNIWIRDELNRHGRDVELSELVGPRGNFFSTKLKPRSICDSQDTMQATKLKTNSRCNSVHEKEREERMRTWIERCPHGRDFPVSPDRYNTEEEYQLAVQQAYKLWKTNRIRW